MPSTLSAEVDSIEGRLVPLPEGVSCEQGTLLRLATEAVAWAASSGARRGDTIVILGQGVVGSLMLQILRGYQPARIVTVDPLPLRQRMSRELGADLVIDPAREDPVAAVEKLTGGEGADLVIDCVGGYDGVRSFEQAQDMVRLRGTIQLIAAYQQRPLALHTLKIMHRRLVAGILVDEPLSRIAARAAAMIGRGEIQAERMITHRFPYTEAKEAFDFLWHSPQEALGVLLIWNR